MPSSNTVELAVVLAGLIVPAWPIWCIRRWRVSVPISALLSCWLLATLAIFTMQLNPGYDSFGAGMTMFFSPVIGWGYALLLLAIRAGTRRAPSPGFGRRDTMTGLIVWGGLCVFGFAYPFVAPPPAREGDPLLLHDYFFFCGPVLFMAVVMLLVYVFRWRRLERTGSRPVMQEQPSEPVPPQDGEMVERGRDCHAL